MTIQDAIRQGTARLEAAAVPDPRLDAEYLLAGVMTQPREKRPFTAAPSNATPGP